MLEICGIILVMKQGVKVKYKIFLKRVGKSIRIIRKSKKLKQDDLVALIKTISVI